MEQAVRMNWRLSVDNIRSLLPEGEILGAFDGEITGMADLRLAVPGQLSFLSSRKFTRHLPESRASVILVPEKTDGAPRENQAWIKTKDPSRAMTTICAHVEERLIPSFPPGIHETALVDPSAEVHESVHVGPYCVIGPRTVLRRNVVLESHVRLQQDVHIGEDSLLHHNVFIGWGCQVGKRCRLFPGVVLGADGFGFHSDETGHQRIAQIGIVILEDDVEMGANSCADRARFSETRIRKGTKIDNLVQVGHNCTVGQHCILCAQVGMAGSSEIGNFVVMAGQVGVAGHLTVGDGVTATGQTGITGNIPPGTTIGGTPARPHREELKRLAQLKRLPELIQRVKELEKRLDYADR